MEIITPTITQPLSSPTIPSPSITEVRMVPCPEGLCGPHRDYTGVLVSNITTIVLIIAITIATLFVIWGCIKWLRSSRDKNAAEEARKTVSRGIMGLLIVLIVYLIIVLVARPFGIDIQLPIIPNLLR